MTNPATVQIPDSILLPSQVRMRHVTQRHAQSPERRLMAAILDDAIHLLRKGKRGAAEAADWLRGAPGLVSFRDVCLALDLDPGSVRRALGVEC